jgi:hypothetical protein
MLAKQQISANEIASGSPVRFYLHRDFFATEYWLLDIQTSGRKKTD